MGSSLSFFPTASSIKRVRIRTHFSLSLFSPSPFNQTRLYHVLRFPSFFLSFILITLSPSSCSNTIVYARYLSHVYTCCVPPNSPHRPLSCPYLRPWPSCVHAYRLSPSIVGVYTRAHPLFVARKHGYSARARERDVTRGAGRVNERVVKGERGRGRGKKREKEKTRKAEERGFRLA